MWKKNCRAQSRYIFVSFLAIGALNYTGYVSIDGLSKFFLTFVLTVIHFALMVRYRKKEYLTDPSISSIINHIFKQEKPEKKGTGYTELGTNFRPVLTIMVIAYLIYRYAT